VAGQTNQMRVLYITPYVPSLIRLRPYNLIKYLSRRGHLVTVLSLQSTEQEERDAAELRSCCHRVETVKLNRQQSLLNCLSSANMTKSWSPLRRTRKRFINVLKGQMSLVGPRMISTPEWAQFGTWKHNLLTVKPGITGLWQVSGRSELSYEERVRLDGITSATIPFG
jgi:hypothetical protein